MYLEYDKIISNVKMNVCDKGINKQSNYQKLFEVINTFCHENVQNNSNYVYGF